jgi:ABC-type polysaccharide/polyol phosphate transport system ATPase subunit
MDDAPLIDLSGVAKSYRIGADKVFFLREAFLRAVGRRPERRLLWALRDARLRVAQGEAVGVIGHNGAGKSTLLGIVAGTVYPTSGAVSVTGRVCALLELGAGFHPDLTGRENIRLNASLLGLTRDETETKFDDIVAFSELEAFLDTPMRKYSSGMWVRLGFAVAVCARPDVMIVDEVLAVGDRDFQQKCLARIRELKDAGTAFLVVSHNADHLRFLCDRVLWIENGESRRDGPIEEVLREYEHRSS